MIEPTDEMIAAFEREGTGGWGDITDVRAGLAAVLAIVARERCMEPRGHVYHPLAKPGRPSSPYDDHAGQRRCVGCNDLAEWHSPRGCEGDFGHCPCPGLVVAP